MTAEHTTPEPERWLDHLPWTRSLARSLVRDPGVAEDVVQETMLTALRHPPRDDRSPRGWLRSVVRTQVWREWRRERKRALREVRAARKESWPTPEELHERLTTQRLVVDAVESLDEPYRTAILLRYFEGLPPRKIAAQEGVPVETVKTRLRRALEQLRQRLTHSCGGRKAWLIALLPLALMGRPSYALTVGAMGMEPKTKIAAGALILALAGAVLWQTGAFDPAENGAGGERETRAELADGSSREDTPDATLASAGRGRQTPTDPSQIDDTAAVEAEPALPIPATFIGRVFHADAYPAPGVEIAWVIYDEVSENESDSELATSHAVSDGAGIFTMPARERGGRLVSVSPEYTTVLAGVFSPRSKTLEPVVIVADGIDLVGTVVDAEHRPITGARVSVELPRGLRGRFDEVLDNASEERWQIETESDGRFDLPGSPVLAGARFEVSAPGFALHIEPMEGVAPGYREVVLLPLDDDEETLRGVVVDPRGQRVPSAQVSYGLVATNTAQDGQFVFHLSDPRSFNNTFGAQLGFRSPQSLVAVKEGHLPGFLEPPIGLDGHPDWPDSIVIEIGGEPLTITGRVIDAEGSPLAAGEVWVADPTFFGSTNPTRPRPSHVEDILAGEPDGGWRTVETDEKGQFEIGGLLDRDYRLEAMDPETLLRVGVTAHGGSTDVVLELPTGELYAELRGRVVDRHGSAISGASIHPMCDAFREHYQGQVISTRHAEVAGTTTDDSGHFVLERVPQNLAYLRIDGEEILPLEWGRSEQSLLALIGEDPAEIEIVVPRRCHVKVELIDPARAAEVAFLDSDGEPVDANVMQGNSRRTTERVSFVEGRTPTLAVTDAAVTLVLYLAGEEVHRESIELGSGELNLLRY